MADLNTQLCFICQEKFDNRSTCVNCFKCDATIHKSKCANTVKVGRDGETQILCKNCPVGEVKSHGAGEGESSSSNKTGTEEVLKEIRGLSKKFDAKFQLLTKIDEDLRGVITRVDKVESTQSAISSRVSSLDKSQKIVKEEMTSLKSTVESARSTIEHLEDYGRRNTIEVHGVPLTEEENLFEIIKDLGKALNVKIEDHNIDALHRLPSRVNKNVIIVKFSNRWICDTLKRNRLGKKLCTSMIGFNEMSRIYINVSLGRNKSYLAKQTRKMFRDYDASVRVDDGGSIYVQKWYESAAVARQNRDKKCLVTSCEDFNGIIAKLQLTLKNVTNE